ncbi:hypothetical protein SULI_04470 [Saccharolobus solfataricus]|uniref:Uncharacterized protein n=3 Tax=Saccharolobus solfataricus TaxID=2287 RepID=Q97U83_SACS2|nr:hypothetical protein [Saccharolobus solfataricus]AAK43238.1 Hypothetical protein SSO3140 [Saccharolobus solfataricus P2]AKA73266.1 hypothetical protein SULB_0916 [Saccharolobus solfataricus]AKA75965.1 hypothetical protein SULC_0915 [Saccharolobus solfataricus]AKA78658.1 hypothetical protein SULA_0914 [Saccharolobus solfataricus]AZF67733.1 hypothetical protein SULG_04470 [Saccharolobus solfataricus]
MKKALSSAIFLIITLIILLSVLIPALLIFNSTPIYSSQGQIAGTGYQQLQKNEQNQVFRGNPNIYYNSSIHPYLEFLYNSIPYPLNITQIYYFNGSIWVPVLKNSIVVAGNQNIYLPRVAFNQPIIIVSSQANFYFLNPNTSVTTVTISGPSGKIPVYVTAFVINGSKVIPVSVQVILGANPSLLTPQVYYLNPGTYSISDKNGSTIFLQGYGLTATFQNWTLVGYGNLNSPSQLSTAFTVTGPLVLTAIYKAQLQKFNVLINTNGLPLGSTINQNNNQVTLTSLNKTIPVLIDSKQYYIGSNGIKLQLTYGYHIIQFPSYYNITFNYTSSAYQSAYNAVPIKNGLSKQNNGEVTIQGGQINCYQLQGLSTNTSKISVINSYTVFVNGSGKITANYNNNSIYYLVIAMNYFQFPNGVWATYNNTPVNGSIARQLLQVQIGTDQQIVLGNPQNYIPEKIYFKAGTNLLITLDYLNEMNGTFQFGQINASYLLSYPTNVTLYNLTLYNLYTPYNYSPKPYEGNYGIIYINSPTILINYQQWEYYGEPYQDGG